MLCMRAGVTKNIYCVEISRAKPDRDNLPRRARHVKQKTRPASTTLYFILFVNFNNT